MIPAGSLSECASACTSSVATVTFQSPNGCFCIAECAVTFVVELVDLSTPCDPTAGDGCTVTPGGFCLNGALLIFPTSSPEASTDECVVGCNAAGINNLVVRAGAQCGCYDVCQQGVIETCEF